MDFPDLFIVRWLKKAIIDEMAINQVDPVFTHPQSVSLAMFF